MYLRSFQSLITMVKLSDTKTSLYIFSKPNLSKLYNVPTRSQQMTLYAVRVIICK